MSSTSLCNAIALSRIAGHTMQNAFLYFLVSPAKVVFALWHALVSTHRYSPHIFSTLHSWSGLHCRTYHTEDTGIRKSSDSMSTACSRTWKAPTLGGNVPSNVSAV
ncbi:hypothetical protein NEOLEDRAFT_327920 [Neolentinus lepideus HHB14362 ss-1]|uniref:Uncharacterized protein n=1 Tax=Neolentinus lepideus HHB14362 ss-1 TaxID=1314782 RepID=A0A165STK0_9AGAM|nr:hypothetical protein NEOLEDRAFT_327920 [Neolentinus lepideus HHB14362 ss-1]